MTAFIDYTVFQNRYSFSVSYCRESYEKYYTFKKNVIKIIILFYLIKYFPDNLNVICFCNLISLQVWMFLIYLLKRNLFSYSELKMTNFWNLKGKGKFGHFSWRQKIEIYFSCNTFVLYICWQGDLLLCPSL